MRFQDAVATCFRNYANFTGRARRSEYWFFVLFGAAVALPLGMLDGLLFPESEGLGPLGWSWLLVCFLPGLAVGVRRLHDLDSSGWWNLIGGVPVIGWIVLLVWLCSPGTDGSNRYGMDPLADRFGAVPA